MSKFAVETRIVSEVLEHPNADRLELVKMEGVGWQVVVQKDYYNVGDVVVYFPIDSLLPMWIMEALELTGKLSHGTVPSDGSERLQNRLKTVKLRGRISQGLVCKPSDLLEANKYLNEKDFNQDDVTELLRVEKYEPPYQTSHAGNLVGKPGFVNRYDIENIDNYPDEFDILMGQPCYVTEKLEGVNWWCGVDDEDVFVVGTRNHAVEEIEGYKHDAWEAARRLNFEEIARGVKKAYGASTVVLRGELVGSGVQGNYYKLNTQTVYLFDIEINGMPIDAADFVRVCKSLEIQTVPVLVFGEILKSVLSGRTVTEYANGKSLIKPSLLREGIVIKPLYEMFSPVLSRLFLKFRSQEYLANEK